MRIGVWIDFPSDADTLRNVLKIAAEAERHGFDSVWIPEGYGTDAVSVLGAVAATTHTIGIGSGVMQVPARPPAAAAMAAATLDALSGGRFRLGLGVSGPQVAEGWYGVAFRDPLGRAEEYIKLIRDALAGLRLQSSGLHFPVPLPDGAAKPLRLAMRPQRARIPVYLAALGPRNMRLVGSSADGWLGIFVDAPTARARIGLMHAAAIEAGRDAGSLTAAVQMKISLDEDLEQAANLLRSHAALYFGGMGSRATNFYHRQAAEMGFGRDVDRVRDLFLSGDRAAAARAVPFELLDRISLLGTPARIARRILEYEDAGVTTINLSVSPLDLDVTMDVLTRVADSWAMFGVTSGP